jgi:Concanavalin A-like lectin/glucanases superfamily
VNIPGCPRSLSRSLLLLLGLCFLWPAASEAQPFGAWFTLNGTAQHGYVRVPHSAALNQATAITVEAWVNFGASPGGEDCRSIAGKGYTTAWWLGRCNGQLRAYFRNGSARTAGAIPQGRWTHVAAVFDGVRQKHYINGELVLDEAATGPPTTNSSELRIGSDVSWERSPNGALDEVRLWSVARTEAQIRANLNVRVNTAQAGLVGVWALDGNAQDVVGTLDGSVQGAGTGFLTFPVAFSCGATTATTLCLDDRFAIQTRFRTGAPGTAENQGQVVTSCTNDGSGLFWFFNADNWEVMVKSINGCGLNNRFWLFSAATTNVFYRMEVLDIRAGVNKIYFNYPGPPAPAVTDTNAFATCP